MIQWSVYGRIANGFDQAEKHLQRLNNNLPPDGSVRCLQVSEKQFTQMKILVGEPRKQEKTVNSTQMILL